MNQTLELLNGRKSVRAYETKDVPQDVRDEIIKAALRAPTAGNMMLYSILEIKDQAIKEKLVETCDNQPMIAKAPFVLLFLADYQRWYDYYAIAGVEKMCTKKSVKMRTPEEGDLLLACCDALIAAQTAVVAAEAMGLGTCYIGDILENYEVHRELFDLPDYVLPITMVCFGYPTGQQASRPQPPRYDSEFIVFENKYKRLSEDEFARMYSYRINEIFKNVAFADGAENFGQHFYLKKFDADFTKEMNRSVRAALKNWTSK